MIQKFIGKPYFEFTVKQLVALGTIKPNSTRIKKTIEKAIDQLAEYGLYKSTKEGTGKNTIYKFFPTNDCLLHDESRVHAGTFNMTTRLSQDSKNNNAGSMLFSIPVYFVRCFH